MTRTVLLRYALYLDVAIHHPTPTVTSEEIGALLEINPTQVRRDLARFNRIGKRGVGFEAGRLEAALRKHLAPYETELGDLCNELSDYADRVGRLPGYLQDAA